MITQEDVQALGDLLNRIPMTLAEMLWTRDFMARLQAVQSQLVQPTQPEPEPEIS